MEATCGPAAYRDDHVPCRDPAHAALAANRQGVRIDKRRFALEQRDVVAAQLLLDHLDLAADDGLDSGEELIGGGATRRPCPGQPVTVSADAGVREDRFADGLARDRARVDADAAHATTPLDHRGAMSELRCLDRGALPGGSAADRNEVVVVVRWQLAHLPWSVILTHSARHSASGVSAVGAQPCELVLELLDPPPQILDDEIERIRRPIPVFHDGPQPRQDNVRLVDPLAQASVVGRARGDLEAAVDDAPLPEPSSALEHVVGGGPPLGRLEVDAIEHLAR